MNFEEYNVLGTIINDGWGQSTEDPGGSFKVIAKITAEKRMCITCMIVVNLLNRNDMQKECKKAYEQCQKACNEKLKQIKKEVVSQNLLISNRSRFEELCEEVGFESVDLDEKKYAVLAYLITKSEGLNFGGLEVKGLWEDSLDVSKLMSILESEMYMRAQAHYERNFKIKV